MKRVAKKKKRILVLPNIHTKTVAIILVAMCVVVVVSVALVDAWRMYQREQSDHLQPLVSTNVPYCHGEKLDIVVPQGRGSKPLVVYVHGGGWRYGSKVGGTAPYFFDLVDHGIAVASINYRLSDRMPFPAQLQDVQCAVRFLKSQSEIYGINPNKILLAGQSAGGNLAMLAAVTANNPEIENHSAERSFGEWDNQVAGVIALDAHYDFTNNGFSEKSQRNISLYLNDAQKELASPQTYLDTNDPAMLIFHGVNDKTVNISQAENFAYNATQLGVDITYVPVKNADHNLWAWFGRDQPNGQQRFEMIKDFILKQ